MDGHPGVSASPVDRDASAAWGFAVGLEDATPERYAATMQVILNFYGADAARIEAAAALCRAHHQQDATTGWDKAVGVLEDARRRLRDAGADVDEAAREQFADRLRNEMFPEVQPFTWTARTAASRGWPRRLWIHARLRWQHQAPQHPAGHQLLFLRLRQMTVGKLDFQVCDQCRRGYVRKLDVLDRYRGLGVGARMIRAVRRRHPGYEWRTTVHYPTAGTFWTKMSNKGGGFQADPEGTCRHMPDGR